jgi:hypothetical protein
MELNFTETSSNNAKRVSFVYEDENDDNVEDIGIFDGTNFTPSSTPIQNSKYTPDLPNVGKFQTINRAKPILTNTNTNIDAAALNTRVNAPMDASMYTQKAPHKPINKKKISYDDILASLNMTVIDGKLHYLNNNDKNKNNNVFMQPKKKVQFTSFNQTKYNQNSNGNQFSNQNINISKNNYLNTNNHNLDSLSFENEKQTDIPVPVPIQSRIPLTKEQYKKYILFQRIKRIEAIQRINKMKPNKMFFSTNKNNAMNDISFSNNYRNNNNNFNRLFTFKS